jgi:hypothetical protein
MVAPEMGPLFWSSLFAPPGRFLYAHFHPSHPLEVAMRDVGQVIREKELEIVRVRQEIEALRSILPLLMEEDDDVPVDAPVRLPLRAATRD